MVDRKPGTLTLKVKRDRVLPACKALLDELDVKDIDIHEVPIEEVVRQIFSPQSAQVASQATGENE